MQDHFNKPLWIRNKIWTGLQETGANSEAGYGSAEVQYAEGWVPGDRSCVW